MLKNEIIKYIINGLFATLIHFSILTFNIEILHSSSAGIANFIAAIFGITVSFIGSRYFVFQNHKGTVVYHAFKFVALYGGIAVLHGFILFVWADYYHMSYQIGFVLATAMQVILSYFGNKKVVFK
jgi:putative flippase GtrA